MNNSVSVIILAAGLGTRMKSKKAKVLHKLSGVSMINHIIKKSYEISDDVSVVLSHQFEEIKSEILSEFSNVKIYKQDLNNYPGTAGALKNVEFHKDKTLILCGDMPLIKIEELKNLTNQDADVTLSVFKTDNAFGYGRVVIKDNQITKIVEQKDASEDELKIDVVNAGCYCIKSEILKGILPQISNNNAQNEYYLTDCIEIANKMNKICKCVFVKEENFMGINDKFALSIAEMIMQKEIKKDLMKQGVLMRMPDTIYIDARAKFDGECELQENVSIIGKTFISNSIIKSSSVIEDSEIHNSDIGPMAHIRPNSNIKDTHIGNFVELKSAKVDGIKAGHLSYLGDCEIDKGTNIGCGTITCNYDGKSKHKTIIGKNVFVGSDTQFVAPVKIEDDVIIASGSTITKDVSKGELAISRTKQINKEKFFYKFFGAKNEK